MGRRKLVWLVAGLVLVLGGVLVLPTVETSWDVAYICENTASTFGYRQWPGGLRTGAWYHSSPLEQFLAKRSSAKIAHRWTNVAFMGRNAFGSHISFVDGAHGGALQLRPAELRSWISHHPDREVFGLYRFLCTATYDSSNRRAEQVRKEVEAY